MCSCNTKITVNSILSLHKIFGKNVRIYNIFCVVFAQPMCTLEFYTKFCVAVDAFSLCKFTDIFV